MFLWNVLSRNTIMKLKLKPATLLKKISILFISFIFLNLRKSYFWTAPLSSCFRNLSFVRKKNSVEKGFSGGICVCKKGKNTNETWQEKDLSEAVHDYGKATLFSKVYTRLRRSKGPIENVSQVFFILCLNYYTLYFEN